VAGERDLLIRIRTLLVGYDEAALIALGNKGLLRRARKDLEGAEPELQEEGTEHVTVSIGGETVTIPESIKDASCTCPSSTTCRHVLAALIHLQFLPGEAASPGPVESPPPASCAEEVAAVSEEELVKWAGKGLINRALKELAGGIRAEIQDGSPMIFEFPHWNQTVRWIPGGGLAGMVCSCHSREPCLHRVAAVVSLQADRGMRDIQAEVQPLTAAKGAPRTREEVLSSVNELVGDMVCLGFSRLSTVTEQRLRTLAVSAHGVDLPRLEKSLRALADEVDFYLKRDAQAVTANMLWSASRIEALRVALKKPTPEIIGQHRTRYDPVGAIEIVGVGARRWRTRSGYTGLTIYFWDCSRKGWATWTDARPATMAGFDSQRRYGEEGPWVGCENPSQASRSRIRLTGAYRNRAGRLSGRSSVHALVLREADPSSAVTPVTEWKDLVARAAQVYGGSLAGAGEMDYLVLVAPASWGQHAYDKIRQELVWPVMDESGAAIPLVLQNSPENDTAIHMLESQKPGPDTRVLGTLLLREGRLVIEPIAVHNGDEIISLTLDREDFTTKEPGIVEAIKGFFEDFDLEAEEPETRGSATALGLLLTAAQTELETVAEGGVATPYDLGRLARLVTEMEHLGLGACVSSAKAFLSQIEVIRSGATADHRPAAVALTQAYYVLRIAAAQEAIQTASQLIA